MKTNHSLSILIAVAAVWLTSCVSTDPVASGSGVKRYPLNTCIVTDNELGSMGDIITKTYGNQEVSFCCKPCIRKFEADPEKFLAKLPR